MGGTSTADAAAFDALVQEVRPRLLRALVASYGPDDGRDACAAALAWAWEHVEDLPRLRNPAGYLYRVGQSSLRRRREPWVRLPAPDPDQYPDVEPALPAALESLSVPQRTAVLLVHGHGWTLGEAAEGMGITVSTLRNHLARALTKLRAALEVDIDA